MASRCAASRTARPDPGRQKRKLAPIKHLPPNALTFTSAFAPVPPYSNLHFKCRRPPTDNAAHTGTETRRPHHHRPTNSSLSLSLPFSSSLVSSHFVLRLRRMRCHRIPREYILAPAAKIKVPARMSYGDPFRVPSAMLRACPRIFAPQTTSLFAILFGVPPFRVRGYRPSLRLVGEFFLFQG